MNKPTLLTLLSILLCSWTAGVAQTCQAAQVIAEEDIDTITWRYADGCDSVTTLCERSYGRFAIKTNIAYLAAGVTNIGGEMKVSSHWSVELPLVYSPYALGRNYRMRFLYIQPEARYWILHPFKGHFFGIHAHIGVANVSFNHNRYQTPDGFYGIGISYGYSLTISKWWIVEFTIGAGYFHTKYDTYRNIGIPVGQRFEKGKPLNYCGIDKVGINLVYCFGDKRGKREGVVAR